MSNERRYSASARPSPCRLDFGHEDSGCCNLHPVHSPTAPTSRFPQLESSRDRRRAHLASTSRPMGRAGDVFQLLRTDGGMTHTFSPFLPSLRPMSRSVSSTLCISTLQGGLSVSEHRLLTAPYMFWMTISCLSRAEEGAPCGQVVLVSVKDI